MSCGSCNSTFIGGRTRRRGRRGGALGQGVQPQKKGLAATLKHHMNKLGSHVGNLFNKAKSGVKKLSGNTDKVGKTDIRNVSNKTENVSRSGFHNIKSGVKKGVHGIKSAVNRGFRGTKKVFHKNGVGGIRGGSRRRRRKSRRCK